MEPIPRDFKHHLDELTATIETLRCAVGAIATQMPARAALLTEYDAATAVLQARTQGEVHTENYLARLAEHVAKTRRFLSVT